MANKKDLKKNLNFLVIDVVEEAYNVQLSNPAKKEVTDKFIDEVIDFQMDIVSRIHAAKSKADYKPIRAEIEQKAMDFIQEVNNMY